MATAEQILAKRNATKAATSVATNTTKDVKPPVVPTAPVVAVAPVTTTPPKAASVEWKPAARTASYTSRSPNTEVTLGDKTSFKFNGNFYTTSKSVEIYELDSLCRRVPNVFAKVA